MVESVQSGAKMTSRLGKLVQFCKRSLVAGSLAAALGVTAFAGFEGYKFHKATSNPGEWTQKENIEALFEALRDAIERAEMYEPKQGEERTPMQYSLWMVPDKINTGPLPAIRPFRKRSGRVTK